MCLLGREDTPPRNLKAENPFVQLGQFLGSGPDTRIAVQRLDSLTINLCPGMGNEQSILGREQEIGEMK